MSTKHFFNDPTHLVNSALLAASLTNPALAVDSHHKIVYLRPSDAPSQVSLVSGGGSGHEPSFTGLVGQGLLTASVAGTIFASPSAEQISAGIVTRVDTDKGVLAIVKNYTGDVLNFETAVEKAKSAGVKVDMVVVGDDVGVGRAKAGKVGRRGIAGTVLVVKIAGALAELGYSLEDVRRIANLTASNLVSVGASLDHVHVPGRDVVDQNDSDRLKYEETEVGMGIHNEAGSARLAVTVEELVKTMLKQLLDQSDKDRAYLKVNSKEVVLLVNNLGGVSPLEMGGITTEVAAQLRRNYQIEPCRILAGTYMTSLNGSGFSITLLNTVPTGLPPTLLSLLDAPSQATGWAAPILAKTWTADNTATREKTHQTASAAQPTGLTMDEVSARHRLNAGLARIIAAEPRVTRYDTVVGDGDCGIGLKRGAEAVQAMLVRARPSGDVVVDVRSVAAVVEASMDGTSGALYTIFLNALVAALRRQGKGVATEQVWAKALSEALLALERYTPAKPGDRTLVDALEPFVVTLGETGDLKNASEAAKKGAEGTRGMEASLGRTVYVGGQGFKDVPDPGAYGLSEFFLGFAGIEEETDGGDA
ncbi:dihydroxyacetone kinase [Pseudogymnoascus sp. 24MN13]|nr:dihydroxyacetone kinase [Pseudogymnoascus sp. 24MN13]